MMLTGNADLETAAQAVNEGHIFRFLTKPCPNEVLEKALEAGLQQYRLVVAERQLLDETLNGSIKVLTDVLSLVNPSAFGRSSRLRRCVKHIAAELDLSDAWQYEVAAMLSQIGCVVLPSETLQKVCAGQELTQEEAKAFASHPDVGGRLLVNIPRLENIAHMIARQMEPFAWAESHVEPRHRDPVALGANVLRVALDFDRLVSGGMTPEAAIDSLRRQPKEYDLDIVRALGTLQDRPSATRVETLPVSKLDVRMVLDQDVLARNGSLLVAKGQEVTFAVLERLRRWAQGVGVMEPIRVLLPRDSSELPVQAIFSGPPQPAGAEKT
jgi:response regulator RpfG family c-di-GMP phosphodiesterase